MRLPEGWTVSVGVEDGRAVVTILRPAEALNEAAGDVVSGKDVSLSGSDVKPIGIDGAYEEE